MEQFDQHREPGQAVGPDEIDLDEFVFDEFSDVTAFVRRFGANVLTVHACPANRIGAVGAALTRLGRAWDPVGFETPNDPSSAPAALMVFSPEALSDADLGALADDLCSQGIGTFGYSDFHDHELSHAHMFARAGDAYPRGGAAMFCDIAISDPRFATDEHGITRADAEHEAAVVEMWCFGAPADLLLASDTLPRFVDIDPISGPDGLIALRVLARSGSGSFAEVMAQCALVPKVLWDRAGIASKTRVADTRRRDR